MTEGCKYTADVQFIDQDFAVISLGGTAQLTLIQTRCHVNDIMLESEKLTVGKTLQVEVIDPICEELQGLPLVSWGGGAPPKRSRIPSENQTGSRGHRFGEILQGKVRSVKPTSIKITLEDGSKGIVHVSEVMEPANVHVGSFPTSSVKPGSMVTCRVIGGRETSSNR